MEVTETTAETDVGGGDVLVVDDTSTVRSLLKRAVSRLGLTVDTASTGQVSDREHDYGLSELCENMAVGEGALSQGREVL